MAKLSLEKQFFDLNQSGVTCDDPYIVRWVQKNTIQNIVF